MKKPLPFANKDLGQHFLKDTKVITGITSDFSDKAQAIIEIGPGPGILTENLSLHNLPFHVIEKDERMEEYIEQFVDKENINFTDALEVNYSEFIKERGLDKNLWLVSNLPYNVSTPLLLLFLQTPEIKYMTLMFQKEVADKVFAFSRTKNVMGSLMSLSQTYFKTSLLFKVAPGAFIPPPKVDSAVISFERIEEPVISLNEFKSYEKFLRLVFSQKRKQMKKVLKSVYAEDKVIKTLEALNLPLTIRAEALELSDIQNLYKELN